MIYFVLTVDTLSFFSSFLWC